MNVRHPLTSFFAFFLLLHTGCAHNPRVALELPHNDAPPAERRAAYHKLKFKRLQGDVFVLHGGEEIHDLRDLLPVVMTSSSTARTIRKYQRAKRRADLAYGLGIPLSIVVPLGLLSFIPISQIPGDNSKVYAAMTLGTGVLLVGLVASFVVGVQMNQRMLQLQQQMARTYNKDLRFLMEINNTKERTRSTY
ncbi:MAG: hypothetical protein EP343_23875 [Deltaproteobacteria bacterium]|nr:MAG: hypothetical protein EP343_23875 [Deltaproteobacteria bacterium]